MGCLCEAEGDVAAGDQTADSDSDCHFFPSGFPAMKTELCITNISQTHFNRQAAKKTLNSLTYAFTEYNMGCPYSNTRYLLISVAYIVVSPVEEREERGNVAHFLINNLITDQLPCHEDQADNTGSDELPLSNAPLLTLSPRRRVLLVAVCVGRSQAVVTGCILINLEWRVWLFSIQDTFVSPEGEEEGVSLHQQSC